jgi:hypothetical protein
VHRAERAGVRLGHLRGHADDVGEQLPGRRRGGAGGRERDGGADQAEEVLAAAVGGRVDVGQALEQRGDPRRVAEARAGLGRLADGAVPARAVDRELGERGGRRRGGFDGGDRRRP